MESEERKRKRRAKYQRRSYWKHREKRRRVINANRLRRRAFIIKELGGKCVICGEVESLSIHHLDYKDSKGLTLRALEAGKLVLLCRKHHRAVHYVNILKRAGYLEKVLELLNTEPSPT